LASQTQRLPPISETGGEFNASDSEVWPQVFDWQQLEDGPLATVEGGLAQDKASHPVRLHGLVSANQPLPPAIEAATLSPRANAALEGQPWIDNYRARIDPLEPQQWWIPEDSHGMTPTTATWWAAEVREPISTTGEALYVDIAALTAGALRFSSYVRTVSTNPAIRESELVVERAAFDWKAFLEATYDDVNDPVGSLLTTGTDATRYKNRSWGIDGGLRRRNEQGGEVEIFQRLGREQDNSRFLDPNPQSATRLELQYTQPLLRGAGRAYNQSLIVLAQIELNQSSDAVADELQNHLVKVTEAYWELYRARAEFLQRRKLLTSARNILVNLQGRREIDAVERQIFRAQTAVANRESEMFRVETRIRNWQSQLRLLVNDPTLISAANREFLPIDSPLLLEIPLSMSDSLHTALINRPDISQAIRDARAASVRLGVAQKDVLPKLDLVASTYVAGLAAATDSGQAYRDQFTDGRPTVSFGLEYEIPIGNRASRAQARRRQWELDQAMSRFSLTVEESLTSVEVAVREVETSFRVMNAKRRAMDAAQRESEYLSDRWKVLPSTNDSAAQLLENLLDAQERVADEEQALVGAQVNYALALIELKKEMGTLLRFGGD
jgi:outer membrane protein TolC